MQATCVAGARKAAGRSRHGPRGGRPTRPGCRRGGTPRGTLGHPGASRTCRALVVGRRPGGMQGQPAPGDGDDEGGPPAPAVAGTPRRPSRPGRGGSAEPCSVAHRPAVGWRSRTGARRRHPACSLTIYPTVTLNYKTVARREIRECCRPRQQKAPRAGRPPWCGSRSAARDGVLEGGNRKTWHFQQLHGLGDVRRDAVRR